MNTNIVILAAGPPKVNRQRHLETFNGQILINKLIEACMIKDTSLYIVIHKNNTLLLNHVQNKYKDIVAILISKDDYAKTTITTALSVKGDVVYVCGDLINVNKEDIIKFIHTKYSSALCRYKTPWGNHIQKNGLLRRADIGDCIVKIAEKDKQNYLKEENWTKSIQYFKHFYPHIKHVNMKNWNDTITHLHYNYFYEIWGNVDVNEHGDKGTVYYEKKIYADND